MYSYRRIQTVFNPSHLYTKQSKITREALEQQRQLLVDLRHEIGELKSIHQAGVVGSKGGGTRGGYGTAMPASEFFKQGEAFFLYFCLFFLFCVCRTFHVITKLLHEVFRVVTFS